MFLPVDLCSLRIKQPQSVAYGVGVLIIERVRPEGFNAARARNVYQVVHAIRADQECVQFLR